MGVREGKAVQHGLARRCLQGVGVWDSPGLLQKAPRKDVCPSHWVIPPCCIKVHLFRQRWDDAVVMDDSGGYDGGDNGGGDGADGAMVLMLLVVVTVAVLVLGMVPTEVKVGWQ